MGIFELDRSVEGKQGSTSRTREGTKPPGTGLRATWLGHSTVFIEIDGYRVLSDRVWGPRASPPRLVRPKRFQPVPVPWRKMPHVDVVVAVEPVHADRVTSWWRAVDAGALVAAPSPPVALTMPKSMPWPLH